MDWGTMRHRKIDFNNQKSAKTPLNLFTLPYIQTKQYQNNDVTLVKNTKTMHNDFLKIFW